MSDNGNGKKKTSFLSGFRSNWLILVICFISAVIMWGLIMKDENPERTKTISNVQLVFDGEADLISRHLVVMGDRDKLPRLTVKVTTDLLKYADLSEADITASVDLRKVNGEGTYELSVSCTSTNGTVVSFSPKKVTIEVDRFNSKKIPVEIEPVNSLEDGYQIGEIKKSKDSIQIEGANSIISNIVKAYYQLDLSEVTDSINEGVSLTLLDDEGNEVSSKDIYGEVPSVNITVPLYSYRELGFDVESILVNKDLVNPNYEIVNIYTVPDKVKILSDDEAVFSKLKSIKLNSKIDLSGEKSSVKKTIKFTLDDSVWMEEEIKSVEVNIIINEKQIEKTFENLKVKISGEDSKYHYQYVIDMTDVTIKCGISLANKIDREDIILTANVSGIENTHEFCFAPINVEFVSGIDSTDVYVSLSNKDIKFIIEEK